MTQEHTQRAIERRLARRRGASGAVAERLREFNKTQTYRGQCRVCRATWSGTLGELPSACPNCGLTSGT